MEWRRHVIADTLREHLTVARAPTAPVSTASTDATTTDSDAITTVAESTRSLPPLCPRQVVLSAATVRTTSDMRLLEKWKFSVGMRILMLRIPMITKNTDWLWFCIFSVIWRGGSCFT